MRSAQEIQFSAVLQVEKLAYGVYYLGDGGRNIATSPLTPEELEDYRRYPDTFFRAITPAGGTAHAFVEKCDFLFKTYQHSTREKLLEFMATAPDLRICGRSGSGISPSSTASAWRARCRWTKRRGRALEWVSRK